MREIKFYKTSEKGMARVIKILKEVKKWRKEHTIVETEKKDYGIN